MEYALELEQVKTQINGNHIHHGVDLKMHKSEILAVVGASGAGKSVLLRAILGLLQISGGTVKILNQDMSNGSGYNHIAKHIGVLFQNGALFSSLTVEENILYPMERYLKLSLGQMKELVKLRLHLVGLSYEDRFKYPSQLSGGMVKRAALARALALDPELLFLDEPTSGLDPISAGAFDETLRNIQELSGVGVYMITHDLESIRTTATRVAILEHGKMLYVGKIEDVLSLDHEWVRSYFHGQRAHFK